MIEEVERTGDAVGYVKNVLDSGERLMGFGHRVYRAEDPRARVLRRTAKELGAPRYEVAVALEKAALDELRARRPDRVLETNVEFWAAIVLDFAEVPAHMFTAMFTCARTAGWSAHILEQKGTGRLIRPSARYVGPGPRKPRGGRGLDLTRAQNQRTAGRRRLMGRCWGLITLGTFRAYSTSVGELCVVRDRRAETRTRCPLQMPQKVRDGNEPQPIRTSFCLGDAGFARCPPCS